MRVEVRARRIQIDPFAYHSAQRLRLAVERRQHERELLFMLACCADEAIDVIPPVQTERSSQR